MSQVRINNNNNKSPDEQDWEEKRLIYLEKITIVLGLTLFRCQLGYLMFLLVIKRKKSVGVLYFNKCGELNGLPDYTIDDVMNRKKDMSY